MPKFKTSFPDQPCADFYDWYKFIHGTVPIAVREKIDRHGNRRERLFITPNWPLPDNWETMSMGDRMLYNMAMAEQRDFERVMDRFKKSLLP